MAENGEQQDTTQESVSSVEDKVLSLAVPRKDWAQGEKSLYRVYRSPKEYDVIEAMTAAEAIEKSGFSSIVKVMRESPRLYNAIEEALLEIVKDPMELKPDLSEESDDSKILYFTPAHDDSEVQAIAFEDMTIADLSTKPPQAAHEAPAQAEQRETVELPIQEDAPSADEETRLETVELPIENEIEPSPTEQAGVEAQAAPMEQEEAPQQMQAENLETADNPENAEDTDRPLTPEEVEALLAEE
ncbi:MAG: hypothetical protein CMM94_00705 [Rickettsiales bacterium]|nr:hypothetical protein [Rickettsiales bacterium]